MAATTLEILGSRELTSWLSNQNVSLAVSTYQAGKLLLIGVKPDGRLGVFERTFNRCMGLCSDSQTMWMSSKCQVWRLENMLAGGEVQGEFDRLFVPQVGYTTGDIDVHDIGVGDEGRPYGFKQTAIRSGSETMSSIKSISNYTAVPTIPLHANQLASTTSSF